MCDTVDVPHLFCIDTLHIWIFTGANLTSGQKVTAVILHIDMLSTCVHVSILPKLVAKKKSVSVTLFVF